MSRYNEPQLIFWEIIAVIHTFAGTLLIESLSAQIFSSSGSGALFVGGLTFFAVNLIIIGYCFDWKKKEFRERIYKFDPKKCSELLTIYFINFVIKVLNYLGQKRNLKLKEFSLTSVTKKNVSFLTLTFWFSMFTLFILILAKII